MKHLGNSSVADPATRRGGKGQCLRDTGTVAVPSIDGKKSEAENLCRREVMQTLAVLAVFCSSTAMVLAEAVGQPAESFNDRFIALGIAAGLLVFAFFRSKPSQRSPAMKIAEASKFQQPVENTPVEALRPAAVELAVAELAVVELTVVERAVEDDSVDAQASAR
ncbi:MAG: hypothetical protein ACOYMG_09310, partial [Candidatus Methylumidiphilus sp.]